MPNNVLIDAMHDMIEPDFHITPNETNTVRILEPQAQASCHFVDIQFKKSMPYFAFSIDKPRQKNLGDPVYPFFNPEVGCLCSKNDGILFVQQSDKLYIFLIELKSNNPRNYLNQLKAAKIFVDFIIQRIKLCNPDIRTLVDYRGILFSCRRTPAESLTKKGKVEYTNRGGLQVAEQGCHNHYFIQQFL
ncbi:hypothetical protein [Candidatus Venteria ishoeyi]|uniref:Uncharacterized protein n=1 Tax=Candidatus Venteria ishoeyi TaxID=1899563 RepID=A0A1H6FEE2_9GAMM|nr:hypothetical protein [Candidatus Venteria ishoeyi]SEH07699.1 Uncharacterised protein [Candidatus Venteria ishoeyi]